MFLHFVKTLISLSGRIRFNTHLTHSLIFRPRDRPATRNPSHFFRTNSSSFWTIRAIGDETTALVLHHLITVSIGSEKQPDRAEHRYNFQQNIPTVQFWHSCCTFFLSELSHLSQLVAGRVAACFDSGRQRQALVLQNMFSQKALLTQVIQSIQCQSWERLAIQGRAQI